MTAGVTTIVVETPPELAEAYHVAAADSTAAPGATRYEDWLAAQPPTSASAGPARAR